MINLLPDEHKEEIRAGRVNVLLVRYITILTGAVVLLGALVGGVWVVLNTTRQNAELKVSENTQQVTQYLKTRTEADTFRNDLAIAKQIMDKEVTYSKLIYKIADIVPKNVILDSLTLDSQKLGSNATMNASAKTYEDAVQLKDAFIKNSNVFSDVRFETLRYDSEGGAASGPYPVKVNLSVVIQKGALQ